MSQNLHYVLLSCKWSLFDGPYEHLADNAVGRWPNGLAYIRAVSTRPPPLNNHRGPGERAAALAASWCSRRVGSAYGRSAWQMLADAARLGLVRHGTPEAWAAGAVIAVARVNGLLGAGRAITAQQVADELDVTLGALAVIEQQLARALNVSSYMSPRPLP